MNKHILIENLFKDINSNLKEKQNEINVVFDKFKTDHETKNLDLKLRNILSDINKEINYQFEFNKLIEHINILVLEGYFVKHNSVNLFNQEITKYINGIEEKYVIIKSTLENPSENDFNFDELNLNSEQNIELVSLLSSINDIVEKLYKDFLEQFKDSVNNILSYLNDFNVYLERKVKLKVEYSFESTIENINKIENNDYYKFLLNLNLLYCDINLGFNNKIVEKLIKIFVLIEEELKENNSDEFLKKILLKCSFLIKKIHIRINLIRNDNDNIKENISYKITQNISIYKIDSYIEKINKILNELNSNDNFKDLKNMIEYCYSHYGVTEYIFTETSTNTNDFFNLHSKIKYYKDINDNNAINDLEYLQDLSILKNRTYGISKIAQDINNGYLINNLLSKKVDLFLKNIYSDISIVDFVKNEIDIIEKYSSETKIYNYFPYFKIYKLLIIYCSKNNEKINKSLYDELYELLSKVEAKFYESLNWAIERSFLHYINGVENSIYNGIFIYSSYIIPTSSYELSIKFKKMINDNKKFQMENYFKNEFESKKIQYENQFSEYENKIKENNLESKKQTIEIVTIFTALIAIFSGFYNTSNQAEGKHISVDQFIYLSMIILFFIMSVFVITRIEFTKTNKTNWQLIFEFTIVSIIVSIIVNSIMRIN